MQWTSPKDKLNKFLEYVSAKFLPQFLTDDQKQIRIEVI